jgi:prepilin-type N-terminal cleavage/methylation domain-containing protein
MNYELRIKKRWDSERGFTLVELMISLFIVVSLGAVVMNIFLATLRGSRKSTVVNKVRQNGNYAVSTMSREIQYSQITSLCDGSITNSVSIRNQSGQDVTYSCATDNITRFEAPGTTGSLLDSSSVRFTNGTQCQIVCSDDGISTSPPQVTIQFSLSAIANNSLPENNVTIPFKTSVVLRNYTQ